MGVWSPKALALSIFCNLKYQVVTSLKALINLQDVGPLYLKETPVAHIQFEKQSFRAVTCYQQQEGKREEAE